MITCSKCGSTIYEIVGEDIHTDIMCAYVQFKKGMEEKEYQYVEHDDSVVELINSNTMPTESFKWRVAGAGYVEMTYVPQWLKNGMSMFYDYNFPDMSLVEFLNKMYPPA